MNLHQVLTGAVNPGDHCFSVGSVGDQRFTVREAPTSLNQLGLAQNDGQRGQERLVVPAGVPRSPTEVSAP